MEIIFVYALVMKNLRDNLALDAIKYKSGNLAINSKPKIIYIYIYIHTHIYIYIYIYKYILFSVNCLVYLLTCLRILSFCQ
jgi:hypothetical protein